jgi:hypothetical protein
MTAPEVAEFQGLYGPYTVSELLLQKIWARGLFQQDGLTTVDGQSLVIRHPGEWNRLGGPDFRRALLMLDGQPLCGDVEVHFRQSDWRRHAHDADEAYNDVVLHVVLFPPSPGELPARNSRGKSLPCFALLDRLHHDLEEYAMDDALSGELEPRRDRLMERLLAIPLDERRERLLGQAWKRWEQKVYFADIRLKALGWKDACHYTALECLGYRVNRGPMLSLAARFPLEQMAERRPRPEALVGAVPDTWTRDGLRPANHPVVRIRQYLVWAKKRPDWPERLRSEISSWPRSGAEPRRPGELLRLAGCFRREYELPARHRRLEEYVAAGSVPGSRFATIICDGFLPLAAAAGERGLFSYWFYWYPGDAPDLVREVIKTAEITDGRSISAANGWIQGVLFSLLDR